MLATLIFRSLAETRIQVKEKPTPNTLFDILYQDDQGNQRSTTNNKGYYAVYRTYDENDKPGDLQLIKSKTISTNPLFTWSYETDSNDQNVRVWFRIFNGNNYERFKVDIGIFGDADYDSQGDSVTLEPRYNGNAITFKSGDNSARMLSFVLNHTQFEPVSTIYMGTLKNSDEKPLTELPFWKNNPVTTTSGEDTVLAFSWQQITLVPFDIKTKQAGFIVTVGADFVSAPIIKDLTEKKDIYPENVDLKFQVTEYNPQEVTLYVNKSGTVEKCNSFTSDGRDDITRTFTCPLNIGTASKYTYQAWAVDADGNKSAVIEEEIRGAGDKPVLNITTRPIREYWPGETIHVEGLINYSKSVQVKYQFNELEIYSSDQVYNTDVPNQKQFSINIPIPNSLRTNAGYTLHVWAEGEAKSDPIPYEFYYYENNDPYIIKAYCSHERVPTGKTTQIVVFGEGNDQDRNNIVTVWGQLEQDPAQELGKFKATDDTRPFAFYYTFPNKPVGEYKFKLYATDNTNRVSKSNGTIYIKVWDPSTPQSPSEIGRIDDISDQLPATSNALFNLQFEAHDRTVRRMSHNNEGFFAAFRTYDGASNGKLLGTHIIKHSEGGVKTADQMTVKFTTKQEEKTNFRILEFEVKNDNYFARKFELSLFVDSDLSGDDNTPITKRKDGRGLVVSSSKYNVKYTIFTSDYFDYPAVTYFYLNNVERNGNGELQIEKIPFFMKYDTENNYGMIGMSWMNQIILPDKTAKFAIVLAAHDNVKTPPRLVDTTVYKELYEYGETFDMKIRIVGAEIGQTITYSAMLGSDFVNDNLVIKEANQEIKIPVTVNEYDYFYINVNAMNNDEETRYPSNSINKQLWIAKPPTIKFNRIKPRFHDQESIVLSGKVTANREFVFIWYQFIDDDALGLEEKSPQKVYIDIPENQPFEVKIKFPDAVKPRDDDWKIRVWCSDNSQFPSEKTSFTFHLNPCNPPKLIMAGLSKKSARPNEQLLAFVVLSDKEKNNLNVYVKLGKDSKYPVNPTFSLEANPKPGEEQPFAFFWQVPQVQYGVYDVYFQVYDSEDLHSEEYIKTLVITG